MCLDLKGPEVLLSSIHLVSAYSAGDGDRQRVQILCDVRLRPWLWTAGSVMQPDRFLTCLTLCEHLFGFQTQNHDRGSAE